jgi:hypothetical protein
MARRSNQKLKLLYLARILLEMTDERHGMTLNGILEELNKYGIEAGRKSVYDDMESLRVYGYDVRTYRDRYVRYYIGDRDLSRAETKLICEVIASSGCFKERKCTELIRKLWKNNYMVGIPAVRCDCPPEADESFKNVETACRAIVEDKRMTFRYFEWNSYKQRKLKFGGGFLSFSPRDIVVGDGGIEIVGLVHEYGEIMSLSPERMVSAAVVQDKRLGAKEYGEYLERLPKADNLRLSCANLYADEVFGRFGADAVVLSNSEDSFEIKVSATVDDSLLAWIFTSAGKVRITAPESAVDKYNDLLLRSLEREAGNE